MVVCMRAVQLPVIWWLGVLTRQWSIAVQKKQVCRSSKRCSLFVVLPEEILAPSRSQ